MGKYLLYEKRESMKKFTMNIHEHIFKAIEQIAKRRKVHKTSIVTLALLDLIHKDKNRKNSSNN